MAMQVNSWMIDSFLGQSAVRKYHTPVGLQTVNSAAVGSGDGGPAGVFRVFSVEAIASSFTSTWQERENYPGPCLWKRHPLTSPLPNLVTLGIKVSTGKFGRGQTFIPLQSVIDYYSRCSRCVLWNQWIWVTERSLFHCASCGGESIGPP